MPVTFITQGRKPDQLKPWTLKIHNEENTLDAEALIVPACTFLDSAMAASQDHCGAMAKAFVGGDGKTPGRRFSNNRGRWAVLLWRTDAEKSDAGRQMTQQFLDQLKNLLDDSVGDWCACYICALPCRVLGSMQDLYHMMLQSGFKRKQGTPYVWCRGNAL